MLAFTFTAEQAELFFSVCHELKADTEEQRLQIISAMAKLGKVKNIVSTKMTKDEYIKHLAKNFTCAIIKSKDDAQQGDL